MPDLFAALMLTLKYCTGGTVLQQDFLILIITDKIR